MGTHREVMPITTKGEGDIIDITDKIRQAVSSSRLDEGLACAFVPHSTAAVFTVEYEPGLKADIGYALERTFPKSLEYEHHKRWGDGNGHSHVRASFLGSGITIPFHDGRLDLGTWQQVVLMELDIRARKRDLIIQIMGE